MNSFNISTAFAKDVKVRNLIAKFSVGDGFSKGVPARKCTQITEAYGDNASHADVVAPLKELVAAGQWDQRDPVALNAGGPAGKIKIFSRASCGLLDNGKYVPLVNGWVVDIGHHMRADCVTWKIFDDRHIMTRYLCFGRMVYEPGAGLYFNSNPNDGLIFNRDGHGDMLRVGGRPRFAVGRRYGSTDTAAGAGYAYPSAGSTENESRTGSWRASDIIEYLRDFFTGGLNRPNLGQDYGEMALPKTIRWPRNLGAVLGDDDRTPQHMELQGMDALSALRRVVQYCGPYDIHMTPINDKESELKIISFNASDKTGSYMYTARYLGATLEECANNPSIIWDGIITESGRKTFAGGVVLMGDSASTELMASTDTSGVDGLGALGYAEHGWTTAEQTTALAYLKELNVGTAATNASHPTEVPSAESWNHMADRYPNVFAWYKISAAKNPFSLTKWANLPHVGSPRIKSNLLTTYNENTASPIGMMSREVIVEHKISAEEYSGGSDYEKARGWWRLTGKYSAYQISPCARYIAIPGLRDGNSPENRSGTTYQIGSTPGTPPAGTRYDGDQEAPRKIRFQVAVEHNQCMLVRAGKSDDDPTGTMHRIDKAAPKWACQILSNPLAYVDHTRTSKSYPCGVGGIPSGSMLTTLLERFPAKATEGNELFSDLARMRNHANIHVKNFKRVDYQGVMEFAQLTVAWRVGMQITVEAENVIGKVGGVVRAVSWSDSTNHTQVEFGPNDLAAIYDGPIAISSMSAGGSASGGGSDGGKKTDDSKYDDSNGGTPTSYDNGGDSPSMGSAASSNAAISSDNDSGANNSAIKNNRTSSQNMSQGTFSSGGGGGNAGFGSSSLDDDIAVEEGAQSFTGAKRSLAPTNYSAQENAGSETKKGQIFTGGDLLDRDETRRRDVGMRAAGREGGRLPVTSGRPEKTASQETRMKEQIQADVARGFNPSGAAPRKGIGGSSKSAGLSSEQFGKRGGEFKQGMDNKGGPVSRFTGKSVLPQRKFNAGGT